MLLVYSIRWEISSNNQSCQLPNSQTSNSQSHFSQPCYLFFMTNTAEILHYTHPTHTIIYIQITNNAQYLHKICAQYLYTISVQTLFNNIIFFLNSISSSKKNLFIFHKKNPNILRTCSKIDFQSLLSNIRTQHTINTGSGSVSHNANNNFKTDFEQHLKCVIQFQCFLIQ